MDFFKLEQDKSASLAPFPEIFEFGYEKYNTVRLGSLEPHLNPGIEICFIEKGQYNWFIEDKEYFVYPKNVSVTLPWEYHGSGDGIVDIGILYWIIIVPELFSPDQNLQMSSSFTNSKEMTEAIGTLLKKKKHPIISEGGLIGEIFRELAKEIIQKPWGYTSRVYSLLSDLLLLVARNLMQEEIRKEQTDLINLNSLDAHLKTDLSRKWTVDEMAAILGRGVTSFTAILQKETGFTPLNYLIDLRIKEAKRILSTETVKITDIAWICGFSSSQHFANTFKQKTGLSPSAYIKSIAKQGT